MSSSVHHFFPGSVPIAGWLEFCREREIVYSPNTAGQSTFYLGDVEITLAGRGTVRELADGRKDWTTAEPPARFDRMTVGSYFGSNLEDTGALARSIWLRFGGAVEAGPELDFAIVDLVRRIDPDDLDEGLVTDDVRAWERVDGILRADVEAGRAIVSRDGPHFGLEIGGVRRATFATEEDAVRWAGHRGSWDWWQGPRPSLTTSDGSTELASGPR